MFVLQKVHFKCIISLFVPLSFECIYIQLSLIHGFRDLIPIRNMYDCY